MITVSIALRGEKKLLRTLATFKERVQGRITRQSINAMARPIVKEARKRAPRASKLLAKSIGIKVWYARKNGTYLAMIGPRTKMGGEYKGRKRVPTRYAHMVERGYTLRNGVHVPARPFLKPALTSQRQAALNIGKEKLRTLIQREVARLAKKGAK